MPFEEVSKLKLSVEREFEAWEDLFSRGKTAKEAFQEFLGAQAANLQRSRALADEAEELVGLTRDAAVLLVNIDSSMSCWIEDVGTRLGTMRTDLDTRLVPALEFARDVVGAKVESLRAGLEAATDALATSLTDRFGEARDTVLENLSAAVEALESAFAALIEGLSTALTEARSAIDAAWEETKEASETARQEMSEKGQAVADALEELVADVVGRVTGKLMAVADDVKRIIETFETTFGVLQRVQDVARTITEGASVGMGAAARALDTARSTISAVG